MSGGAILGALLPGTALAATVGAPPSSFGAGDIGILNYALTLEYLESAFYNAATKNNIAKGDKLLTAFLKTTITDENAHVTFAEAALGSKAGQVAEVQVRQGRHRQGDVRRDGVRPGEHRRARLPRPGGQHREPGLPAGAASIVTVEARHSGAIGLYLGKAIAPTPFDTGWTAAKVLAAVKGTGFIQS